MLRSKGSNQFQKIVINILEGQRLQRWEGWFDGRRPRSGNKHKQQQQEHKQQEKQQQAAESGAAQTAQTTTQKK